MQSAHLVFFVDLGHQSPHEFRIVQVDFLAASELHESLLYLVAAQFTVTRHKQASGRWEGERTEGSKGHNQKTSHVTRLASTSKSRNKRRELVLREDADSCTSEQYFTDLPIDA